MTAREPLPNRRAGELVNLAHGGFTYVGHVGRYPDGRLAEVFLDVIGKARGGEQLQAACRDAAVLASLALQHGCPADRLRDALTRLHDGTAAGPLGELLDIALADEAGVEQQEVDHGG